MACPIEEDRARAKAFEILLRSSVGVAPLSLVGVPRYLGEGVFHCLPYPSWRLPVWFLMYLPISAFFIFIENSPHKY